MAIYHCSAKIISRSAGRSAVAAAAYRSAEKLIDKRQGITHDYTRKGGVDHTEIMLPANAPAQLINREVLWNTVEKVERRKDAQTAREIEVALPIELNRQEQIGLIREYVQKNFVDMGMCADICIHDKGDGNPHAHVLLTTRTVNAGGFAKKCREWNRKEHIETWREQWASACNRLFEQKNIPKSLDHRSYERQNKVQTATIHLGKDAAALERRGIKTDRGKYNDSVRAENKEYQEGVWALRKVADKLKAEKEQRARRKQTEQPKQQAPWPLDYEAIREQHRRNSKLKKTSIALETPQKPQEAPVTIEGYKHTTSTPDTPYIESDGVTEGVADAGAVLDVTPEAATSPEMVVGDEGGTSVALEHQEPLQEVLEPSEDMVEDDIPAEETAEQVAERLLGIKADYVAIVVKINRAEREKWYLEEDIEYYEDTFHDLEANLLSWKRYGQDIERMESERAALGLFSGKKKKYYSEEIGKLTQIKEEKEAKIRKALKADETVMDAFKRLKRWHEESHAELEALPDIAELKSNLEQTEQLYEQEWAKILDCDDVKHIAKLVKQGKNPKKYKHRDDEFKAEDAENKLRKHEPKFRKPITRDRGRER